MEDSPAPSESLGEFLRSERERRGLSIEQVASATKISQRVLYALESDHYSDLPALPFVRGFVKNYAKFIGLDGSQVLNRYKGFLEQHSKERPNKDAGHSGYAFERPEGEQAKKVLSATMTGILLLGALVVFVFKPSLKKRHSEHIEKIQSSALPVASPEGTAVAAASGVPHVATIPSSSTSPSTPVPSAVGLPTVVVAKFIAPKIPLVFALPTPTSVPATPVPATPKPTVGAVAAATSAPTAAPATPMATAVAGVTPTPVATPSAEKPDELQSGLDYDLKEVKYKIIVRALADVTVRYQCDEKRIMKFTLKADKILVLRGKSSVRLQVSNPDSATVNAAGAVYRPMSKAPGQVSLNSTPTWVWPAQPVDNIDEKFKSGSGLPKTAAPDFETQSAESTEG